MEQFTRTTNPRGICDTASLERIRSELSTKYDVAAYWRRHYEVDYQQNGSVQAQRSGKYYEGLMRGYQVALDMLSAV